MTLIRSSNGSYAEYVCVAEELVYKKPKKLSFEQAAAVPLAAMTAYRATVAFPGFKKGSVVFVAGIGGGVGSFAVQFLQNLGVKEIFTIAKNETSAGFIHEQFSIPLDHILLYEGLSFEELRQNLLVLNQNRLFTAALDLIGGKMKSLCLELTDYSGFFSTVLPEKDFTMPFWEETALPRSRNMTVCQVSIAAELSCEDRRYWQVYRDHLSHISFLFDTGTLQPPCIQVLGSLNAATIRQAHALLEESK